MKWKLEQEIAGNGRTAPETDTFSGKADAIERGEVRRRKKMTSPWASDEEQARDNYRDGYEEGKAGNVLEDMAQGAFGNLQNEDYARGYDDGQTDRDK